MSQSRGWFKTFILSCLVGTATTLLAIALEFVWVYETSLRHPHAYGPPGSVLTWDVLMGIINTVVFSGTTLVFYLWLRKRRPH